MSHIKLLTLLALAFGIINVMWMEAEHVLDNSDEKTSD